MNLGAHVSIAGSLDKSIDRAVALGCSSIQIFPGPPQTWFLPKYSQGIIDLFVEKREKAKIKNVYIHAIYLLNLASPDKNIYEQSLKSLEKTVQLQLLLQADGVIFHPGSHRGTGIKKGINAISYGVNKILSEHPRGKIIFEFSAGAGDTIGRSFEELHQLLIQSNFPKSTAICLDSCHLFASGIDFSTPESLSSLITSIDKSIGKEKIEVIHLNDSQKTLGSNRDIHANIGEGQIRNEGLKKLIQHQYFSSLPIILETPIIKNIISELNNKNIKSKPTDALENIKQLLS